MMFYLSVVKVTYLLDEPNPLHMELNEPMRAYQADRWKVANFNYLYISILYKYYCIKVLTKYFFGQFCSKIFN